jgi:hypothetical protein
VRPVRITWELVGAWETWYVSVPDDAPNPLTAEWVNDNFDKIEFHTIDEDGRDQMVNPEIDEID